MSWELIIPDLTTKTPPFSTSSITMVWEKLVTRLLLSVWWYATRWHIRLSRNYQGGIINQLGYYSDAHLSPHYIVSINCGLIGGWEGNLGYIADWWMGGEKYLQVSWQSWLFHLWYDQKPDKISFKIVVRTCGFLTKFSSLVSPSFGLTDCTYWLLPSCSILFYI